MGGPIGKSLSDAPDNTHTAQDRHITLSNFTDPEKPRREDDVKPQEREAAYAEHIEWLRSTESDIRDMVDTTADSLLNDARAYFTDRIRAIYDEFAKFRKTYQVAGDCNHIPVRHPPYYDGKYHALSGGHVVLREDDPASIIAYTLS